MTRRIILSFAVAAVTATTLVPATAGAESSQRLTLSQGGGHTTPDRLKTKHRTPSTQAAVYETYEDKLLADCNAGNGGMITGEDGNYDCIDSDGNSLWD